MFLLLLLLLALCKFVFSEFANCLKFLGNFGMTTAAQQQRSPRNAAEEVQWVCKCCTHVCSAVGNMCWQHFALQLYYTVLLNSTQHYTTVITLYYTSLITLYYTVLHCTTLHMLHCTTLYFKRLMTLYYTKLHYTYYTIRHYSTLYYAVLLYATLQLLHPTTLYLLHYTTLFYTVQYYSTLYYTTLSYADSSQTPSPFGGSNNHKKCR